jgi:hypothetical protein
MRPQLHIIQLNREGVGAMTGHFDNGRSPRHNHGLNLAHYIARLNIAYYKKLLETEINETTRRIVTRLLAEEHANLVEAISKVIVREADKDPDQKRAVNG